MSDQAKKIAANILRATGSLAPVIADLTGAKLPGAARVALGAWEGVAGIIAGLLDGSAESEALSLERMRDEWRRADDLMRDGGNLDDAFAAHDKKLDEAIDRAREIIDDGTPAPIDAARRIVNRLSPEEWAIVRAERDAPAPQPSGSSDR